MKQAWQGEISMSTQYPAQVSKWDVFEVAVEGPSEGNPFTEQYLKGIFSSRNESVVADGFYDGDGIYRIRFMPSYEGKYTFVLKGSFLNGAETGAFYVGKPQENNHGIVRTANVHHFVYEDGTPYIPVGTTAYVWHLQSDEKIQETLKSLEEARFNKLRFCIFPKHYAYNLGEPRMYPYEGTPMDSSVINEENFFSYLGNTEGNDFDFTRFNPAYFRHIENCIRELADRGIEADLICMHPYDRWGFSKMTAEQDDLYFRYIIARFSAFHNVWWALANEYDLLTAKTAADWERYASILVEKDLYKHLRSIHNCRLMYDHSRNWITHCSVQRVDLYKTAEITDELAARYQKPVVMDEIAYEGDLSYGFGNITGEEMVRRFWETAVRGGYPGHGETFQDPEDVIWWSHGGALKGESWKRAGFLLDILKEVPGNGLMYLDNEWDSVCGVPETEWSLPVKSQYIYYYSFMRPSYRIFHIDDETDFIAEIIDTWNMTVRKAGIHKGTFRIDLPGRQYMAIRLRRPTEDDYLNPVDEEPAEEEVITEEEPVIEEEFTEEDAAFEALETVDDIKEDEAGEETDSIFLEEPETAEEEEPEFVTDEEEIPEETENELPEPEETEEVLMPSFDTQEIEQPEEEAAPSYVYKHAAPAAEQFSANAEEDVPEYEIPEEEETGPVLVEDDPVILEDDEDIDLAAVPSENDDDELPDIVSGAIEVVDSYDDRTPEPQTSDDDDVIDEYIKEAEKTLDIPLSGFRKDN